MQLDFSRLDTIAAAEDFKEQDQQPGGLLQRKADKRREELERAAEVYQRYQQNTIATSQLRAEILTGIRAGADIYGLFLKAVKALALATNNRELYNQVLRELPEHYQEAQAAAQEAQQL